MSALTATARLAAAVALVAAAGGTATEAAVAALPDGRVWEQVSPVDKNGYDVNTAVAAAADGSAFQFTSTGPFGDAQSGSANILYASRGADGWTASALVPAFPPGPVTPGSTPTLVGISADARSELLMQQDAVLRPDAPAGPGSALYLQDAPTHALAWVTQPQVANPVIPDAPPSETRFLPVGGSPDLQRLFFQANMADPMTTTPRLVPADAGRSDGSGLYAWTAGKLEAVGVLPDGTIAPDGAAISIGNNGRNQLSPLGYRNVASRDGSRIIFQAPDPRANAGRPTQLYQRSVDDQTTIPISRSAVTGDMALSDAALLYASPDGSRVWFTSADTLNADAPNDASEKTYIKDTATGQLTYTTHGAPVVSSDDGTRSLALEPGTHQLWLDDHGQRTEVLAATSDATLQIMATHDGGRFGFVSADPLPGGFNNASGQQELYVYDVAGHELSCVSCPPDGVTSSGPVGFLPNMFNTGPWTQNRGTSDDGRRVFFDSPNQLVPEDINHVSDVYEWDAGGLHLLSGGRGAVPSTIGDNSADGNDVFFKTRDRLTPTDVDSNIDVYDARVAGGFPRVVTPPDCQDGCQGASTSPPALPVAASVSFAGPGNATPDTGTLPKPAAKVSATAPKTVKGTSFRLTVKVPTAGTIKISGSSTKAVSRKAVRAGTYHLTVSLSSKARATLKKKRRLALKVRTTFTPRTGAARSTTVSVTVKA